MTEMNLQEAHKVLQDKKQKEMAEKGFLPFYKMEEGENHFELNREGRVRTIEKEGKESWVIPIKKPAGFCLALPEFLAQPLIAKLMSSEQDMFTIRREGTAEATKYVLVE